MDSLLSVFVLKRRHTLSHAKDENNTSDITLTLSDLVLVTYRYHSLSSITRSRSEILGTTVLVYPKFVQLSKHI